MLLFTQPIRNPRAEQTVASMRTAIVGRIDENARRNFEKAWVEGRRELIERFLPPQEDPAFLDTLIELIHIELEFAWKAWGQSESRNSPSAIAPTSVDEFLARFPQIQQPEVVQGLREEEKRLRKLYLSGATRVDSVVGKAPPTLVQGELPA